MGIHNIDLGAARLRQYLESPWTSVAQYICMLGIYVHVCTNRSTTV